MTFLELVKRLAVETGTELQAKVETTASPPATGYGESTEHRTRLVGWIQQAWHDVQDDQDDWNFMVRSQRMPLAEGQRKYRIKALVDEALSPDYVGYTYESLRPFVARFDARYIWMVDGTTGAARPHRGFCYYTPPERFFGIDDRQPSRGRPSRYSFDRDGCIVFNTFPDKDGYFIEFEYLCERDDLENDADVPRGLPVKHHMVIVYKAMMHAAMFDEAQVQIQRAQKLYREAMNKLRLEQLREYSLAGTYT